MAEKPKKETWRNKREAIETFFTSHHLTLRELKENGPDEKQRAYFSKQIPPYPRPELHLTHLSHSTDLRGLKGIKQDGGFRGFRALKNKTSNQEVRDPKLVWFFLTVTPADLRDAENRDMMIVYPDKEELCEPGRVRDPVAQGGDVKKEEAVKKEEEGMEGVEEEGGQQDPLVLNKFATSPAFSSSSRYGSYRFTFSLRDVLDKYSRQFCGGQESVMRKWKTIFYKQEVVYVVLVHPPTNQRFSNLPLLPTNQEADPVCEFREDHFVWRPQAMSKTHRFQMNNGQVEQLSQSRSEFYVWDHVAVALLLDGPQVFEFDPSELRQNLRFCEKGEPVMNKPMNEGEKTTEVEFQTYDVAQTEVNTLWPLEETLEQLNKEKEELEILQKFADSKFHVSP